MRTQSLFSLLFGVALLLWGGGVPVSAAPAEDVVGWEWRWGDSPMANSGQPMWVLGQDESAPPWQSIAFPSNPPGRNGREHVWFRVTLPDGEWRDPVLYVYSIDLIAQFYLDDELIYHWGSFDEQGRGRFVGWPWHMIELPADYAGKTLFVRVFSDYTDIGLWGEVRLMDRVALLKQVIQRSAKDLFVSAFSLLLALLAGIFTLIGGRRQGFAPIALFALGSGVMILAETQARQLLLNAPLLWDTLRAAGYFSLPVAMGWLLTYWLTGRARSWVRAIAALHLLYLILAIFLAMTGVVHVAATFPPFDLLLSFTLPAMMLLALWHIRQMGPERRLVVGSLALFAILLLVDILVAHSLLPFYEVPLGVGALVWTLAIVSIALWHYRQTQQELARLNRSLEDQVRERTVELDRMVEKLQGYSYEDALTGLGNRRQFDELFHHEAGRAARQQSPLSLVMVDLDHFKQVNDVWGHAAGDTVLQGVARLLRRHFRETDVIVRLGGEEFVALLPGATAEQALERATAAVAAARVTEHQHEGRALGVVTLSCGLATYPKPVTDPARLLECADQALYRAKRAGRDRCVAWTEAEQESPAQGKNAQGQS
ncbi:MAG: diguanylate cyclase [Halothiobacillaceae bacterium]